MSSPAAGDSVGNVILRHRAAVQIQRWFRLLVHRRRHDLQMSDSQQSVTSSSEQCEMSTGEQSVRHLLDAKRQELLRRWNDSGSVADNSDEKDWRRRKEEKARLARQQAIQVHFAVTYLFQLPLSPNNVSKGFMFSGSVYVFVWTAISQEQLEQSR